MALPTATVNVTPDGPVFTGETVTLKCEIEDQNSNWTYQWYKRSTEVFNSENYTVNGDYLTINGVTESDQDEFNCSAVIFGRPQTSLSSSAVNLTVNALPNATVRVTPDRSVFTGETVTLKCEIEDQYRSLNWTYQWYKRSTEVFNSENYTVNEDYLTITGVTESDQDEFSCTAVVHGRQTSLTSSAVNLTVKALPNATVRVTPDRSVFTGETVTLKCEIENQYRSLNWTYQWYKRSTEVFNSENYTVNGDYLTINGVTESDQDEFNCSAVIFGRPQTSLSSSAVNLTVNALPNATVRVTPDRSVFTGETVTLKCEIEDQYRSLNWRYQWYKRSTEVFNSENYTVNGDYLTINGVTESDQDEFNCSAVIFGRPQTSLSSSAVNLTVNALPRATVNVTPDRSVFTGETVTLKCEIEDQYRSLNWRYLWYKGRTEVFNSGRYTVNRDSLTINGVTESDQNEFSCSAVIHGRQTSQSNSSVYLNVNALPRATVRVTPDRSVFTGETVTLKCEIEDQYRSLNWTYLWYKRGTEVFNSGRYTVYRDSLTINGVSESDQDEFSCRAEIHGRTQTSPSSSTVHLTVKALPTVTVRVPPDRSVFTGETVTLTCEIEDQYRSLNWTYLWTYRRTSVFNSGRYTINRDSLTITGVTESDQDEFRCSAEIHGRPQTSPSSSSVYLTVKTLPRATVRVTPDRSVFTGETVTLKCEIEDQYRSLNWRYQWYKDTTEAFSSGRYTVNRDSLTINGVTESDQDEFNCSADIHGRPQTSLLSFAVYLTVKALPIATLSVTPDRSVFTGETVTLKCEIEDQYRSLNWRYQWYKDTTKVFNSGRYTVNRDSLTINGVTESDQNEFSCSAVIHGRPQTSLSSSVLYLTVKGSKPKPTLTSGTEGSVLTGNTVTLKCHIDQSTGWKFYWHKHTQNTETTTTTTETNSYTIHSVSDGGQYWCRAGRGKPDYYTDYSDVLWINVKESPKPVVSFDPDTQLFRGETVTLRCDINGTGDTEWTYSWTVEPYNQYRRFYCDRQECKISNTQYYHSGKYTCKGKIRAQNTKMSDAVTLTVSSDKPQTVLSVSPQQWLTEGDSVTLMCKVVKSSTGWTFSWFTVKSLHSVNKDFDYELVSDSIRGSNGNYTVSSVTVKHTGVYMCRAKRGDPVYHTEYSNTQTLWITGVSPSVSLIIRPNRSQHFSSESLSLSCEDHSNSTGWTVRRYTDTLGTCSSSSGRSTGTTSTCTIRSLITSDTGVYWCQSESGEKLHPVNISVHSEFIILLF
nr:obscurin-like [Misgurnus anguillicaudatus]